MFRKLGNAINRFMYGRYGMDELGKALLVISIVFLLLGSFLWQPFSYVAFLLLAFGIYRSYSRQLARRRKENSAFLRFIAPFKDRKKRYFRCPSCRQTVRVPRGKGHVVIRCPKCSTKFEKNA